MSFIKKLVSQSAIYGVSTVLARLINIILVPVYTKEFTRGEYGIFSDLFSFVTFFLIILTFGMETSFFRFSTIEGKEKSAYSQSFWFVTFLSTAFLVLFGLSHKTLAGWIGYGDRSGLVLIVIIVIFLDVIASMPKAKLRHKEKALYFSLVNLVNVIVNLGLSLIFVVGMDKGVEYAFLSILIAGVVRVGMLLPYTLPDSFKLEMKFMKEMSGYGFFIMLAGLAGAINENLDKILISRIWGSESKTLFGETLNGQEMVGIYSANYKLAIFITLAIMSFRYAAEPLFFKQAKDKNSPKLFARVFYYFFALLLIMFLTISSLKMEIVSFNFWGLLNFTFVDQQMWTGLGVVPVLLLANVFLGAYMQLSIWFKITKQVRFGLLFAGVGALLTIILNLALIPFIGYYGSAWATLICYVTITVLCYIVGQKYYPIPYPVLRLGLFTVIAIIVFLINAHLLTDISFAKIILCLIVIGVYYGIEKIRPAFPKAVA